MKKLLACLALLGVFAIGLALVDNAQAADEKDKPKFTIKKVMQDAHRKGGRQNNLRAKVLAGKASKEEVEQLVVMYTSLPKNKPPKGEAEAWAKRTAEIVKAATALQKGDAKAKAALTRATNCMSCHRMFRGE